MFQTKQKVLKPNHTKELHENVKIMQDIEYARSLAQRKKRMTTVRFLRNGDFCASGLQSISDGTSNYTNNNFPDPSQGSMSSLVSGIRALYGLKGKNQYNYYHRAKNTQNDSGNQKWQAISSNIVVRTPAKPSRQPPLAFSHVETKRSMSCSSISRDMLSNCQQNKQTTSQMPVVSREYTDTVNRVVIQDTEQYSILEIIEKIAGQDNSSEKTHTRGSLRQSKLMDYNAFIEIQSPGVTSIPRKMHTLEFRDFILHSTFSHQPISTASQLSAMNNEIPPAVSENYFISSTQNSECSSKQDYNLRYDNVATASPMLNSTCETSKDAFSPGSFELNTLQNPIDNSEEVFYRRKIKCNITGFAKDATLFSNSHIYPDTTLGEASSYFHKQDNKEGSTNNNGLDLIRNAYCSLEEQTMDGCTYSQYQSTWNKYEEDIYEEYTI